ncbi:hypothetical protein KDK77_05870 [bacterium]|nr:hypothetical protein [bacterium]MCP5461685.1 hypothetical protein [bacterium]
MAISFLVLCLVIFILLFLFFRKIGSGFSELVEDSIKSYHQPEKPVTEEEINQLLRQTEIKYNSADVKLLKIYKEKTVMR